MSEISFKLGTNRGRVISNSGAFYPAGTSAITGEKNTARATVARTAVGKITVTFNEGFGDFYGSNANLNMATPDGSYAQIDSYTANLNTKAVMVIGTYNASNTAIDVAANANNMVTWEIVVRK